MRNPILKLEGRSGCRLEVFQSNNSSVVRKYSKDNSYNQRLLHQAEKQRLFNRSNTLNNFLTPDVLAKSEIDADQSWFEMEYVHGQKYSEFLERSSVQEIRAIAKEFINYFDQAIEKAIIQPVNQSLFLDKAKSVENLLSGRTDIDQKSVSQVFLFLRRIPSKSIPIHPCHGDFTFSNMLFDKGKICLVDFLDSFVESPLIDLVKFRQDTFFYWSLLIDQDIPESRSSKIVQVFQYLDKEIVNAYKENTFVNQWYDYLQVFNLIRILPYVHHPSEIEFVQNSISRVFTPVV